MPPASEPVPPNASLEEREDLSRANAEYRGTIQGAAKLNQWATTKRWLEANPNATDQQLLAEFTPALLRTRWDDRRQATVDYLRDAPRLYGEARTKLDRYDAMPSASSVGEFMALARGELYVAATSWETLIGGGSAKGASWLVRALKTAAQQAGTSAISKSIVQWQNIEAGLQEKFDGWQFATSAIVAALFGLGPNGRGRRPHLGIKEEPPPVSKAPVAELLSESTSSHKKTLTAKERRAANIAKRVAEVEEAAAKKPTSKEYVKAEVGHESSKNYSRTFYQVNGDLKGQVEVHHAIEQNVLKWYPNLFKDY